MMRIQILILLLVHTCYSCDFLPSITCPKRSSEILCQCSKTKKVGGLVCCHLTSEYYLKESIACEGLKNDTKHIYIYNATLDNFDASLKTWSHLDSLTIINSRIKRINGGFTGSLKCVNISSNNITEIDNKVFKSLNKLHTLNISNNDLIKVPKLKMGTENFTLDVSENPQLKCADIKAQADDNPTTNLKFINSNTTKCLHISNFKWFNSTLSVTLDQVENRNQLEQECPKGPKYKCTCAPYRMIFVDDRAMNTIQVNCSGLHLTELPSLPANTGLLDVSRNNITTLERLATDPSYYAMRELIADNNKIDSITALEGTKFIDNFATLSLRENNIKTIPIYILSNTFDRNYKPRQVRLGRNRLNCDCSTAQVLKLWLLANTEHIPDYNELFCEKDLGRVITIDHNKVCVYQKDWTDYIYYIIAAEVMLLLLLISKVSYDYWVFKTSGYLPWPASNMPKLPCDWVFET